MRRAHHHPSAAVYTEHAAINLYVAVHVQVNFQVHFHLVFGLIQILRALKICEPIFRYFNLYRIDATKKDRSSRQIANLLLQKKDIRIKECGGNDKKIGLIYPQPLLNSPFEIRMPLQLATARKQIAVNVVYTIVNLVDGERQCASRSQLQACHTKNEELLV